MNARKQKCFVCDAPVGDGDDFDMCPKCCVDHDFDDDPECCVCGAHASDAARAHLEQISALTAERDALRAERDRLLKGVNDLAEAERQEREQAAFDATVRAINAPVKP